MKRIPFYILLFFFGCLKVKAQQLDSLKYQYGNLFFHHFGKGDPLILLSGGPGNDCLMLEETATVLGKYYHVVLPQQRGTGRSIPSKLDSATINIKTAVDDLKRILNHLKFGQAIFVGHSWGGMLAMAFASQHPTMVRSLILIAPGPFRNFDDEIKTLHRNQRSRLSKFEVLQLDSITRVIENGNGTAQDSLEQRRLLRPAYVYDKSKFDDVLKKINVRNFPAMTQLIRKDLKKNYDLSKSLSHYPGPIDVVCGQQDILAYCTYELKILRPSVSVQWIEESGHFPMFEQPAKFYSILLKILRKN